jgi:hypothetical protein
MGAEFDPYRAPAVACEIPQAEPPGKPWQTFWTALAVLVLGIYGVLLLFSCVVFALLAAD